MRGLRFRQQDLVKSRITIKGSHHTRDSRKQDD